MDHRQLLRFIAIGRMALGTALLAAPRFLGRRLVGEVARSAAGRFVIRIAGARDLAIGYGTFRALQEDRDPATWAKLAAACDTVDATAALLSIGRMPTRKVLASMVAGGAAAIVGFRSAAEIDDDPPRVEGRPPR